MNTVQLSGSLRTNVGKAEANALRKQGRIPCVLYGNGNHVNFHADEKHFKDVIYTPETKIVELELDGKKHKTVIQEIQFHRINDKLMHVDFLEVDEKKPVTVMLPVKTIGQAEGVKAGGKLSIKMRKLKVRGLISKMPKNIELNIEKLGIGKTIAVGDINIDGLTVVHPKNISVVGVQTTRNVAAEETAAAPAAAAAPAPAAKAAPAPAKK
ncbi:MAG: 50S ribosomal protein L25/general stress protein Ctc [Bacteroidetes bacterium]|nr:50S ribosomal protein L25/general stress protein Ctc [Bacteroidota bacterium]